MTQRKQNLRRVILTMIVAASVAPVGCSSPTTRTDTKLAQFFETPQWVKKAPWTKSDKEHPEPYPNPVKVAATWTSDVLVQTGKTPTRGFGGRLFFFDEKSKAVPVEGTLTVHGFETNGQGDDAKIKPFKFTPEQFTNHFSQSDFGASYSVWIPWDAAGGDEKRISLVPTFQTAEGKIVQGAPATVLLPGLKPESAQLAESDRWSPRYRTHNEAVASHATRPSGLVTTTIRRHNDAAGASRIPALLQERAASLVAAGHQNGAEAGKTPFVDIQSSQPSAAGVSSGVMAASATMDDAPSRRVRSTRLDQTVPRRIVLPTGKQ